MRSSELVLMLFTIAPLSACASQASFTTNWATASQVWFTPNGAADFLNLFSQPERWPSARSKVTVLKFYGGRSLYNRALLDVHAFAKLQSWRISIALECTGVEDANDRGANGCIDDITYVINAGGRVKYVAMDEPYQKVVNGYFLGGGPLGTVDDAAKYVARFIQIVHSRYPDVIIGDIEAFPASDANALQNWIEALENHGVHLPFFQLDTYYYPDHTAEQPGLISGVAAIKAVFDSHGIPLIPIVSGPNEANDDYSYYQWAMGLVNIYKSAMGLPQTVAFQSWTRRPVPGGAFFAGPSDVPINLPENDPTVFSHTRLINEGMAVFSGSADNSLSR
jgi:hypothetical protein